MSTEAPEVIVRFAPSPTGRLHVGNARTALFNWLFARKAGGKFMLRLDDTDDERSTEEYAHGIVEDLGWLGLVHDILDRQSNRMAEYDKAAEKLKAEGVLYPCYETPEELEMKRKTQARRGLPPVYDRAALSLTDEDRAKLEAEGRQPHWRFKLAQEITTFTDLIFGETKVDCASVSDPVLIRGDGQYLYTLASVVDDVEMGITNVVRGSDHVTNTATQIQMIRALGGAVPQFAHHSLLTGPQGEALSKRLGTLALRDMRTRGIAPEALASLMARLGSSQPVELHDDLGKLAEGFELSQFGSAPTKFDVEDLIPLTARHLQNLPLEAVAEAVAAAGVPDALAENFWTVTRDNISTLNDLGAWWELLSQGAEPVVADEDRDFVDQALALLPDGPFDDGTWSAWTAEVKAASGRKGKSLFMPLRLALTGQAHGPDMASVMPLLQVIKAKRA